jgi:hypothetical protein
MGTDLEKRIDRLESLEALRKLKHTYCKYCDENYDSEKLKTLFWDDAVWDAGPQFGQHKGPDAIAAFFKAVSASIVWARHYVINERIELSDDGNAATGEFQIIEPCTFKTDKGDQAAWLVGQYSESYTRRAGIWKYQTLKADIEFITPYDKGWAIAKSLEG